MWAWRIILLYNLAMLEIKDWNDFPAINNIL